MDKFPVLCGFGNFGSLWYGDSGRCHTTIHDLFFDPYGRWHCSGRRGTESEAESMRSELLRPMPKKTFVYERCARPSVTGRSFAALEYLCDGAALFPAAKYSTRPGNVAGIAVSNSITRG